MSAAIARMSSACLIIIGINGQYLGEAVRQIIEGAFTPAGAAGALSARR